ncbi:caspase family protein [Streptomyces sp. NBC_00569]|uniref:caspase family protein n=1 Tax=Streptomyces sp. NBC_00569 TaxID=2975780 RepID=UPI002E817676|nr:caspase family protein [Streptomyces sp. NBC_00569]WUB92661.1 caspase family protein [Streptomyces sp. NBC_00569]
MTTCEDAEHVVAGRRFLIAAGVGVFRNPGIDGLPGVAADVRRVRELLEPMGYTCVLTDLADDPPRDALAEGIEDWTLEASLGPEDMVVVYFAGHGVCEEDRHYLLCADSRPGRWTRALAAEDLARPLVKSAVGHLLVILDTCYAGAGTADVSRLAADLADLHRGRANRWHLAAARARDRAKENVFVDALADVFAHPRHGATQRYVSVREVTERVNAHFRTHRPSQQARLTTTETDGQDPFFPSPVFLPGLPADGIDLAGLALLRRRYDPHYGPRSRGLEHTGERGDYFTGRARALDELTAFLTTPGGDHDRKARVVTGDPGSGKSALLGRLLALAGPDAPRTRRDGDTSGSEQRLRAYPSVIAPHARRASLAALVADLAAALHLPAPADRDCVLAALSGRTAPVAVVVDSLDEAGAAGDAQESRRIARELLQPLSTLPAVRLVVGTRRPQVPSLGHAVHVLDLDAPEHITRADITTYARAVLEDAQDPDSRSPYRHDPALAATIADGIAERARFSYLVARMTARALVHGQISIDTSRPDWREHLPSDAKEAFATYLDRFGSDRPKAERLLRPLAYAQGAGLPWSTLWAPLAEALSGLSCSQNDLDWLHRHAGVYIVETPTPDGSAYRLFHETMAEHLRRTGHEHDDHATIAHTLTALVHKDPASGVNDWPAAHPYIRHHAATHAAAGGVLVGLLSDPEYLVHAAPASLLRALDTVTAPAHRIVADIYRASAAAHAPLPADARRDILAIDAARYEYPQLAAKLARTRPWAPRWATGSLVHPAHRATLTGHTGGVSAVAVVEIDNRPHAVTAGIDGTVRVWDVASGTERAVLAGHTGSVIAVAASEIDNRPHVLTTHGDGTVRVWDLLSGSEHSAFTGHTDWVTALAVSKIGGHSHVLTASIDGTVRVRDLASDTERAVLAGHTDRVKAVAMAEIDDRPHALTAHDDGTVRVWDLVPGFERIALTGHIHGVNAVVVTEIDNRPHALTAGGDGTARVWDLVSGSERAVLTGHFAGVNAVAVVEIDNRPHAVTASEDRTVRVWDLVSGSERTVLTGHTDRVTAVAVTVLDNRPHAVTSSDDETVRVWDLASGTEHDALSNHTRWVSALATAEIYDSPYVLTGDGGTVRVRELATGTERAALTDHSGWVSAFAMTEADNRPNVLIGGNEMVQVWDLATGTERAALTDRTGLATALVVMEIDNRPHSVTASHLGTVQVWDLASGTERAALSSQSGWVGSVAVTEIGHRPYALFADGETVRVWDVSADTERTALTGHRGRVNAVAVTQLHGLPFAVTTGKDRTVRLWDLVSGTERAVLTGHTDEVKAVAVTEIDRRPHAITTSDDGSVRVWDLLATRVVAALALPLPAQTVSAHGDVIVLAMAHEVVALQRTLTPWR